MRVEEDNGGSSEAQPSLRRTIGIWQMTFYGTGSMLGAGIYGLVGEAAGQMGSAVWLAFVFALIGAMLTAFSYASLGSRYPRAGGAAYVTHRAYCHGLLTHAVGLAVACSGLTSIAAGAWVIGGNLQRIPVLEASPIGLLALAYLILLTLIVHRGIRESMWVNVTFSLVEAGGLLLIILVGLRYWGTVDLFETPFSLGDTSPDVVLAFAVQGVVLTFFAFLGFEDMLNVAEEVKNPRVVLPLGLIMALLVTAGLYIGVAVTAVSVVPWQELAQSGAPLADVMSRAAPWFPNGAFVAITIFAVGNTGLINFITASRLLYGMARDKRLPEALARVHPIRRTPHNSIAVIFAVLVVLALAGNVSELASATVLLLLLVFVIVNMALVILKLRPGEARGAFEVPLIVPILGACVCLALFLARVSVGDWRAPAIAAGLILGAAALYLLLRPENAAEPGREGL